MSNTSLLQVRTSAEDKEKASEILEKLGTNLLAVVNMMIKQIILTEGIPFEIKMSYLAYSKTEAVKEVEATMAFEGMELTEDDFIDRLRLLDDFNEYYYEGMYQLAADRKEL
ncbi:MAG: type II toxin-antitoxin system RelB/DinJ family antitoxin [Lachnospiraceae bacterium]|nr:type II toxin-antitoxin system RelB/DinJ family antitoxin [Lachnospiraceae bacterium]